MKEPTIPLTFDEVERMRYLLNKVKNEHQTLTPAEEAELREYISRDKPEEAQNPDLTGLITAGIVLFGLYLIYILSHPDYK